MLNAEPPETPDHATTSSFNPVHFAFCAGGAHPRRYGYMVAPAQRGVYPESWQRSPDRSVLADALRAALGRPQLGIADYSVWHIQTVRRQRTTGRRRQC